jgi:hypothetical protein
VVIPYEYEAVWAVDVTGRKLTIQPLWRATPGG